jgi:shikimate kinase
VVKSTSRNADNPARQSGTPARREANPGPRLEAGRSASGRISAAQAVVLVGFMGAGKTSVGRALGQQLGWNFEDLDDRIQAREQRSIERIFRESGETEFRRAEHAALLELLAEVGSSPRVVALGGGAFVQPENAALLAQAGVPVVFLDAPVEELFRRCRQEAVERPLRRDRADFVALYEKRRPHYLTAGLRVDTNGKNLDEVAEEVRRGLGIGTNDKSGKEQ